LFVSHSMAAVSQLCSNSILLKNGLVHMQGPTHKIVDEYLKSDISTEAYVNLQGDVQPRLGNGTVRFIDVYLRKEGVTKNTRIFSIGDDISVFFHLQLNDSEQTLVRTSVELKTIDGIRLANMIDADSGFGVKLVPNSTGLFQVTMNDIRLYPGTYCLSLYAGDTSSTDIYDYLEDCISFEIIDGGELTTRSLPKSVGLFFFTPEWRKINE